MTTKATYSESYSPIRDIQRVSQQDYGVVIDINTALAVLNFINP